MKIILEITQGTDKGKKFEIERQEPDNLTVGRSDQNCSNLDDRCSQFQIAKGDLYLSRWHLLLQLRPPNCYVRDMGSTNHTYVNDFNKGKHIEGNVELKNGDVIKAGRTHIKVQIVDQDEKEVKYKCINCQKELQGVKENTSVDDEAQEDFLCIECRKKKLEGEATTKNKSEKILCAKCSKDLTEKADFDNRAGEFREVAIYYCEDCAIAERVEKLSGIGKYLLLRTLGKGGMGIVYKAWHKPTGRVVALKMILPEHKVNKKQLKLFQRKITVMQDLIHPNIVRLYNTGTTKGNPFFTCEYLPGGNVEEKLLERKKPFAVAEACNVILDILEGLTYAHNSGIVHRDVSPTNMLYTSNGMTKLSDMGLSKSYETAGQSFMTRKGEIAGKFIYMAPEQINGYRDVKPPADVYSTGISLYYMLTGKFPYEFPSTLDRLMGLFGQKKPKNPILIILEDKPVPIRERKSGIPKSVAMVVDKAISKEISSRYSSASEMKGALRITLNQL